MMRIDKVYVRTTRDEIRRYPNWPIQTPISLGEIGFYDGRRTVFDWVTSIKALGIKIRPLASQSLMDEMYGSRGAVNVQFSLAAGGNFHKAAFNFSKPVAVAAQGYKTSFASLPIGPLENALVEAIKTNAVAWDMDWVIVTELWQSEAFTILISGARGSEAEIATSLPIPGDVFNIADFNVGAKLSKSVRMAYHGVAEKAVNPYFQIHRLIHDRRRNRYYLKRYGKNTYSFFPRK